MEKREGAVESVDDLNLLSHYRGKKVLVTGHSGFKGSWMSRLLLLSGADLTGYSLDPPGDPALFHILRLDRSMNSVTGDIRDFEHLCGVVREVKPDYVFHLAAQPLVRESYRLPRETFETNVMGTVNLLESLRVTGCAASVVNVTTDKVYLNREVPRGYTEEDALDGYDPYSNSKSCSDLVTHSYYSSFFRDAGIAVSTARAGNVIGGGDFAKDRIIPDCVRAAMDGVPVVLRHPGSVRPYQHVLEPLSAYLMIAAAQAENPGLSGAWNVGPEKEDTVTTGELAGLFARYWGDGFEVVEAEDDGPHEAGLLMLDSSKLRQKLGWKSRWNIRNAVEETVAWSKAYASGKDMKEETDRQIWSYFNESRGNQNV